MRSSPFRRLLAVTVALAGLAIPSTAGAAWSPPLPVSPGDRLGGAGELDIAFDDDGDAVAAWRQWPGQHNSGNAEIWASTRPAGGQWSVPKRLSADTPTHSSDDAFTPFVVVHPSGRAVVMWTENTPVSISRTNVAAAVGEAGGTIGDPQILNTTTLNSSPALPVFAADGTAHLVYNEGTGAAGHRIYERTIGPDDAVWGAPAAIDPPVGAPASSLPQYDLDLDIDAAGNSVLVWVADYIGSQDVKAAIRPADGTWSAPADLDSNLDSDPEPRVAIGPQGRATVVWHGVQTAGIDVDAASPSWSTPSPVDGGTRVVDLAADASGVVHLVTQSSQAILHSILGEAGFGGPVAVDGSPTAYDYSPRLAVGPAGDLAVAWNPNQGIRVALAQDGSWGAPKDVLAEGSTAVYGASALAFDNRGNVVAGFAKPRSQGGPDAVDLSVLDRTAPELVSSSVADSGFVGDALAFSASAVDDWSPVTYSWLFGDGASAAGASVEHAWTSAGAKQVVLRLTAGGTLELPAHPVTIAAHTSTGDHTGTGSQTGGGTTQTTTTKVVPKPIVPTVEQVVKALSTFSKAPSATSSVATFRQTFPSPGKAVWQLYLGRPASAKAQSAAAKPVLLGSAKKSIAAAGAVTAKVSIAKRRRSALKKARRPQVYLKTTFTDAAGRTFTALQKVKVKK